MWFAVFEFTIERPAPGIEFLLFIIKKCGVSTNIRRNLLRGW